MKFKNRESKEITNIKSSKVIQAKIGNPAKMLRMFTKDLYKHPLQTAIQEYINNAKDAHIMAKKDCSTIEITAPTIANQCVVIKDFGPGLSPDDIVNIFANITTSNKDDSDLFNGGFGIGSKSWFAVNNSFMVVSRYNKTKTYYTVNFNDKKGITISIDHEEKTNEKNGVEVILPLSNKNQIKNSHKAIARAINFWSVRPKVLNLEVKLIEFKERNEEYSIISVDSKESELMVTLGETMYSIKELPCYNKLIENEYCSGLNVVIHFKVGEIETENSQEVGPDRESFSLSCNGDIYNRAISSYKKIVSNIKKELKTLDNAKDIQKMLSTKFILNSGIISSGYNHKLKCGLVVTFNSGQPSLKDYTADYQKLDGSVCQLTYHLEYVGSITDIVVEDKELNSRDMRLAIDTFAINNSRQPLSYLRGYHYSKKNHYNNGVIVVEKDRLSKKELKELNNYFNVRYTSKIDFIAPTKIKKDIALGSINCIMRTDNNKTNSKLNKKEVKDFIILAQQDYHDTKKVTWVDLRKLSNEKNKHYIIVSQKNYDLLSSQEFDCRKTVNIYKDVTAFKKMKKEQDIAIVKEKGLDLIYSVETSLKYIRNNHEEIYYQDDAMSWIKELVKLIPNNKNIKKISSIDFSKYDDMCTKRMTLKQMKIKPNRDFLNFIKKIKKERPFAFQNIEKNCKKYKKELLLMLKGL
jgi:hypothetical protein